MHVNDPDGDALTVSWDKDGQTAAVPGGAPNPTDANAQLTASFPKGTTSVMATATDSASASASVATSVTVQDTLSPVIAMNGVTPMTVECHTSFADPGATAAAHAMARALFPPPAQSTRTPPAVTRSPIARAT